MTFLDSSVIIDMLNGVDSTVDFVQEEGEPYLTSSVCVFEVLADYFDGAGVTIAETVDFVEDQSELVTQLRNYALPEVDTVEQTMAYLMGNPY